MQCAERAGFSEAMCSDHLAPFSERQGESGFAWSWLGAALASTRLRFGTVNAPGERYHPVIVAQAVATLAQMFDGRFWVAFGTGQFINEHVTGAVWPEKGVRKERLLECVAVIRALLAGETVSHRGLVTVSEARLYTLPAKAPPLFAAAISPETAAWAGSWADGLITVYQPDGVIEEVLAAFREGGGRGKPLHLQAQHAFAATDEQALAQAVDQWAPSVLPAELITDATSPMELDAATTSVDPKEVAKRVRVSSAPEQHLEWLREYEGLGFECVYVHNVTREQRAFIDAFGRDVLPHFASVGP